MREQAFIVDKRPTRSLRVKPRQPFFVSFLWAQRNERGKRQVRKNKIQPYTPPKRGDNVLLLNVAQLLAASILQKETFYNHITAKIALKHYNVAPPY